MRALHNTVAFCFCCFLFSCAKISKSERAWSELEQFPERLQVLSWQNQEIPFELKDRFLITEGDLIIGNIRPEASQQFAEIKHPNQDTLRAMGNLRPHGHIWPGQQIPVVLTGFKPEEAAEIKNVLKLWQSRIALEFITRTSEVSYLHIHKSEAGCFADVGHKKGEQYIFLKERCIEKSVIAHLAGHAMGFLHEQNRFDREEFFQLNHAAAGPVILSYYHRRETPEPGRFNPFSIMLLNPEAFGKGRRMVDNRNTSWKFIRPAGPGGADFRRASLYYGKAWHFLTAHLNRDRLTDLIEVRGQKARALLSGNGLLKQPDNFGMADGLARSNAGARYLTCDVNADSQSDLIEINRQERKASAWKGHNATFSLKSSFGELQGLADQSELAHYLCADFSGDGKADVLEINLRQNKTRTFLSTGSGFILDQGFREAADTGTISQQLQYNSGDFNGDGVQDLLEINASARVARVWPGTRQGFFAPDSFSRIYELAPAEVESSYHVLDFNMDGKTDVLEIDLAGKTLRLSFGIPGGFVKTTNRFASIEPGAFVAGDYNGDNRLDIAQLKTNSVHIFFGSSQGFQEQSQQHFSEPASFEEIDYMAGDSDGDGKADLIEINYSLNAIYIWKSEGHGFQIRSNSTPMGLDG